MLRSKPPLNIRLLTYPPLTWNRCWHHQRLTTAAHRGAAPGLTDGPPARINSKVGGGEFKTR